MAPTSPDGSLQGYLGLVKRKGLEKRFFVLRGDTLEYYKNEDEALDNSKAASKVFDVSTITVTPQDDGSITLHIGDQTATLREINEGDADVWTEALMVATGQAQERADVDAEAEEEEEEEAAAQGPRGQPGAAPRGAASEEQGAEEALEQEEDPAERSRGGEDSEGAAENPEDSPEPLEPDDAEDVLCEGPLEIMKKGQKKKKYCVLFKDRLDYWAAAEDRAAGSTATGSLPAEVVAELRAEDWGFSLLVQGEPAQKPLELHSTGRENHRMWLDAMQRWKWGKQDPALPQPATNFSFVEEPSRWEPAAEAAAAPDPAAAPATGGVVHEGPLEVVKGKSAPLRYGVLTGDEFAYFTSKDDYVQGANPRGKAPLGDVTSLRCSTGSGLITMTVKDSDKVISLRPPGGMPELQVWASKWKEAFSLGGAGLAVEQSDDERDDRHDEHCLKAGPFLVNRDGQVQKRYFVLYDDRMESWLSQASYNRHEAPATEFLLDDVEDIEVLDNGLDVCLQNAAAPITLLGPTGKELDAWAETMSRSLGAQGHPGHDGAPAVEPWRPWGAQGGQEGAGPSTEAPCVHKGLLEVGAPGARTESTYVVIFSDRYEEHRSFLDFNAGRAEPLLRVDLSDIAELKVAGATFDLRLRSGAVRRLTEPRKQELQAWLKAWGKALSGPAFDCTAEGRRWIRSQAADGAARRPGHAGQTEHHDVTPPSVSSTSRAVDTKFIKEGLLGFARGSGLAWKYCILEQDHLSAWSDMGAAATRKSPDLVLDISSSGGFQAVGAGFVLACGERKVGVHVGADGDIHGWSQAFSQAFNAHMFDAASPDVASAWTPPSQFGSRLGPPASPAGPGSSGRRGRGGPGSGRAAGPQRSRSVEPGGRGSPGWVPRCALETPTRRPTIGAAELWHEVARKSPKLRSHGPLDSSKDKPDMHISSHGGGAEAAAMLHGAMAKFHVSATPSSGPMRRGGPAGVEVAGKSPLQTRDGSAPLLGRPVQTVPGKVTDGGFHTARCLPARTEVGATPGWSKISGHHEHRTIAIASVAVQEQPCTPKVTTSRRAGSSPPPSVRDRAIASRAVIGKITDAVGYPAPPSSRDTRAVVGKITDAGRSDLRDQLAARKQVAAPREPSHKASDPSRITSRGGAATARVASVDRHTPMAQKSIKNASAHRPRGAANISF